MSCTKLATEYEEIYRSSYLRKFINSLKLLDTKNHSNRSNIKCVLPNQAELAGSELLTGGGGQGAGGDRQGTGGERRYCKLARKNEDALKNLKMLFKDASSI